MTNNINVNVLAEAKQEYTSQIKQLLAPQVYMGIKSMYNASKEFCRKSGEKNILKRFQLILRQTPSWDSEKVKNEFLRIENSTKCDYIEDLITALFISHTKILASIKLKKNSKNIHVDVPTGPFFIHKIYIESARNFWKYPYLFHTEFSNLDLQRNLLQSEDLIKESIVETIRKLLPVKDVLKEYLGNNYDDDDEDDDITSYISNSTKNNIRKLIKFEVQDSLNKNKIETKDSTENQNNTEIVEIQNKGIEKQDNLSEIENSIKNVELKDKNLDTQSPSSKTENNSIKLENNDNQNQDTLIENNDSIQEVSTRKKSDLAENKLVENILPSEDIREEIIVKDMENKSQQIQEIYPKDCSETKKDSVSSIDNLEMFEKNKKTELSQISSNHSENNEKNESEMSSKLNFNDNSSDTKDIILDKSDNEDINLSLIKKKEEILPTMKNVDTIIKNFETVSNRSEKSDNIKNILLKDTNKDNKDNQSIIIENSKNDIKSIILDTKYKSNNDIDDELDNNTEIHTVNIDNHSEDSNVNQLKFEPDINDIGSSDTLSISKLESLEQIRGNITKKLEKNTNKLDEFSFFEDAANF